jgi:sugar lactone lactonase YvrE
MSPTVILIRLLVCAAALTGPVSGQRILTMAGGGSPSSTFDGGLAIQVRLGRPSNMAMDSAGNIFIVEEWRHRVRRFDRSTGRVSTLAGTGRAGFKGDGGPATDALLELPNDVAVDDAGSVYISDRFNNRIRRINPDGIISTFAGDGFSRTGKLGRLGGDGNLATTASFSNPRGIALDAHGNLFIADERNHVIRRIDPMGYVSTFAGTADGGDGYGTYYGDGYPASKGSFNRPSDVSMGASDNLLIVDRINNRVRNIDASGLLTTVAGDGFAWEASTGRFAGDGEQATNASFFRPSYVTTDPQGRMYVSDTDNNRVRRVNLDGTIETIAGTGEEGFAGDNGPATEAVLSRPAGLLVDINGSLLIADWTNDRIRRVTTDGTIVTAFGGGSGDGFSTRVAYLGEPSDAAASNQGILIADRTKHRIRLVETSGNIRTIAGNGSPGLSGDGGLATDASINLP